MSNHPPSSQIATASEPDGRVSLRAWLPQTLVAGIVGVCGGAIGALATGHVQHQLEQQKALYAAQEQRLDKAEEITTLIEKAPETYVEAKREMLLTPSHMFTPPDDSAHVVALVTLYFPGAVEAARAYETQCADYIEALTELAMSIGRRQTLGHPDQEPYCKMMADGDLVTREIIKELGKPYAKRTMNVAACVGEAGRQSATHAAR